MGTVQDTIQDVKYNLRVYSQTSLKTSTYLPFQKKKKKINIFT